MKYSAQHAAAFAKITPGTVAHQTHRAGMLMEEPVTVAMDALLQYAERHEKWFGSKLSEDYFLGPEWLKAITGVRALLNGTGQFDGGTLESVFWSAMDAAGYKEEDI
jgi:hypothetical protein